MPLSDPASVFYKPTALEQAYAIYVYEKLFGRFPAGGRLYLESKTALPLFAQKSGVNTLFLRSIWTVADPDNRKYLDNVAQFHVLLRLIALCQDGLLEQEINKAFNEERGQTTPAAVMKRTLWMSSDYDDCPLPKFEGVTIPSDETLKRFHERLKGSSSTSPVPAPAPSPIPIKSPSALPAVQIRKTPAPAPIPVSKPSPKKASTKGSNKREENIQSAITQIESLSVNNNKPDINSLKDLDPDNFELLQEQAALQRALLESTSSPPRTKKPASPPVKLKKHKEFISEEEALQRAIYESTHVAPPPKPISSAAVAAKSPQPTNWLRMSSFDDSTKMKHDSDDSDDGGYTKNKTKKGDAAYAAFLASKDPASAAYLESEVNQSDNRAKHIDLENDKKPAAKPSAKPVPVRNAKLAASPKSAQEKKMAVSPNKSAAKMTTSKDSKIDEYPSCVQELVFNGFELEKAIQGYKMLGDNFDDIVLFLTSNTSIKELVINGFNIHKVVKAYEFIGDNMDELIAYLMANP